MSLSGGGFDPTKVPTGFEGKRWRGGNPQSWVTDHAQLIFVLIALVGIIGLIIAFAVSALTGEDTSTR